jgi:hypothetical protein
LSATLWPFGSGFQHFSLLVLVGYGIWFQLAEGLAVAVAVAVGLAVDAALAGPALRVRVTGAPVLAGTPAAGFVLRAVSVVCWLVLVSMAATSKPAPEMVLTASSRLWPDTLGMAVRLSGAVPFCTDAAFGGSGGSAGVSFTLGTEDAVLLVAGRAIVAHATQPANASAARIVRTPRRRRLRRAPKSVGRIARLVGASFLRRVRLRPGSRV